MSTSETLLAFLSQHPGEWRSGSELATQLAISRTAIWKAFNTLKNQGYLIESRHGLGYKLSADGRLDEKIIRSLLTAPADITLHLFESVDSTNTLAKKMLAEGLKKPAVIIANEQTSGHGRRDRNFFSPANSGIYMTLAVPLKQGETVIPGLLTTASAVACGRAIKEVFGIQIQYKWVNDLLFQDKKCGGILSEAITDLESGQINALLVGIGINVSESQAPLPPSLKNKAGSLGQDDGQQRNVLIAALINQFFRLYASYKDTAFLDEYRRHSYILRHQVVLEFNHQKISGIALKIDDDAELVLEDSKGQQRHFAAGEITKVNLKERLYHG
ncbi:biotin--[acetyl-CoA-carboxylase] ligase [Oenococcus kitaharae]|uniref:Bifunctional ligase/repressor BirA n=1 Tax=Oenococcus kitaharae DSM 17330 TaxID=1045004 RepID=G9WEV5_9LACO|nr:biotin--[acetyl-CoA-carboxylase] ligase [Oenococcus kitaharae]EHN58278.1 Biotin-protein ligase / Biotin operon repressor [Oenococcus kitaharae DSM 17330]OEY81543.1 biotin operon repressor [Oenococcus kitaharae]OEY83030.1 biotin operon repressor [Oenococcus kitaharae]OEY84425.1 biotin operon repressor [Oenococcus kitaharae]